MVKRRTISFERDVISDVIEVSGKRWTREQVRWCLRASIWYIHHLARYTDNLAIRIPKFGYAVCNLRDMRKRLGKLDRKEVKYGLMPEDRLEMDCLRRKIAMIESMDLKRGHPLTVDYKERWRGYRMERPFEDLQDFQASRYEDFDDGDFDIRLDHNNGNYVIKQEKDKE